MFNITCMSTIHKKKCNINNNVYLSRVGVLEVQVSKRKVVRHYFFALCFSVPKAIFYWIFSYFFFSLSLSAILCYWNAFFIYKQFFLYCTQTHTVWKREREVFSVNECLELFLVDHNHLMAIYLLWNSLRS